MAKATKICKVCGKEYPYCKTITPDKFRWQDVACCHEHAKEYFRLIMESRGETEAVEDADEFLGKEVDLM